MRLLSSLLSLYCAVAALGAFLDATAPNSNGDVVTMVGLAINLAGVYVGGAGMRAARRGDILSACRYDHALRALAASSLAYEAYVSLVVIPEEARHRAPWDEQRPQTNGTTYTQNTSGVSRDDLFLSGVVSVCVSVYLAGLPQLVGAVPACATGIRRASGRRQEVQQPGEAFSYNAWLPIDRDGRAEGGAMPAAGASTTLTMLVGSAGASSDVVGATARTGPAAAEKAAGGGDVNFVLLPTADACAEANKKNKHDGDDKCR